MPSEPPTDKEDADNYEDFPYENNDLEVVDSDNADQYKDVQSRPRPALHAEPTTSIDRTDLLEEMTTKSALGDALFLALFGIASLGLSFSLGGGGLTESRVITALTSPINTLSPSSVLFQYGVFLFASAIITPLATYALLKAGASLSKPDLQAAREALPLPFSIVAPVVGGLEELLFRFLPLAIATALFGQSPLVVFGALTLGSIPWVFAHVDGQYSNTAVLGVFFILLWAGGYGLAAIIVHALHNFFAVVAVRVLHAATS